MPVSSQEALAQARRSRPEPLPADFADEVMARLHAAAKATPAAAPLLRPRDLAALAAMAVLVAGTVGFLGESHVPRDRATAAPSPTPPPLTMFSGQSLFATR